MKKVIAVFLCVAMMVVMIPSFFASASPLPAQEAVVVAADESGTGQVNNDLLDPITTLVQFFELWGGILQAIVGSEVWNEFLPGLMKAAQVVSAAEFFQSIVALWNDIVGNK